MELVYPIVLIVGIPILVILVFLKLKKPENYENGKKIANTQYVNNTPYYKKIMRMYKFLIIGIKTLCVISILMSLILLARPATTSASDSSAYSRDIMLCMDVSDSVNELNEGIVKNLKKIVKSLKGERFGISIFNTSSVTLVPLTDDYNYVLDELDTLEKNLNIYNNQSFSYSDGTMQALSYLQSGTLVGDEQRGSSLIGDGLASCISAFGDFEEERTRIIVFCTDNGLYGKPYVTIEEAAQMCKTKGITVFGIAPNTITSEDRAQFKKAMDIAGGNYYEESKGVFSASSNVSDIVNSIEQKGKSLIKGPKEVKMIDKPEIPFVILNIALIGLFILSKRVNL